jgi:AraC-like DNA-binding protein/ligand-binding sensor protein
MFGAMKPLAFDDLARLPVVQFYETAFRKATGVSLKVVPPEATPGHRSFAAEANGFCRLMASLPAGCATCSQAEQQVVRSAARKRCLQQVYCYAGLTVVAAPVMVDGRHVATLLSGQVFRREPTERDFSLVLKMLGANPKAEWVSKARKSYFETPVLTLDRFQAVLQLLAVFAQYLAESAGRQLLERTEVEPVAVASAKEFVQAHAEEPISLGQVVEHVHVSRFYFCKLFKKATGMTLTEYVTRVRIEKAKALLGDPSRRVSEVVFAVGFGSIPRFNSVFKEQVGMAPTEYRASLRSVSAA